MDRRQDVGKDQGEEREKEKMEGARSEEIGRD